MTKRIWPPSTADHSAGRTASVGAPAAALPLPLPLPLPPAELAVAVHRGSYADLDQTYGALGAYVAEREIGVDGPIREHYPVTEFDTDDESSYVTEVCWPVFQTTPASSD